jgi:flagellar biosynthesis protein
MIMPQRSDNSNRNRTAIALSYNPDEAAPKIIATGKGYIADKILKVAEDTHIPVHKDEQLAGTLSKLEIGDYIPPELYEVVAEILIFVDNMDHIKDKVFSNELKRD